MSSLVEPFSVAVEAIKAFAATDKVVAEVGNSVWEQFARYVTTVVNYTAPASCADNLALILRAGEDLYKRDHKGGCPASYRSAKSTALAAVRRGISLLDHDGNPLGKSAIASLIRDHDNHPLEQPIDAIPGTEAYRASVLARFQRAAAKLSRLSLGQEERSRVRTTCEALIAGLVVS